MFSPYMAAKEPLDGTHGIKRSAKEGQMEISRELLQTKANFLLAGPTRTTVTSVFLRTFSYETRTTIQSNI